MPEVVCIAKLVITVDDEEEMTPANLERIALNQMRDSTNTISDTFELLSWHRPEQEVN